jgi:hypothetical protein
MVGPGLRRRWHALADGGDALPADGDMAVRQHAIGQHHGAAQDQVIGLGGI